jgi:uncharacterized membrane protein
MRGPIDYTVVQFDGNKFDGSILAELEKQMKAGVIEVLDLALLTKNEDGEVAAVSVENAGDETITTFISSNGITGDLIGDDDLDEIAELLDNNCSAGLLVVEQLWAKGLKQAILNANGTLLIEGRIHEEAAAELDNKTRI